MTAYVHLALLRAGTRGIRLKRVVGACTCELHDLQNLADELSTTTVVGARVILRGTGKSPMVAEVIDAMLSSSKSF